MSELSLALARQTRRLVVETAIKARTCHIGSSLSIVDILAVLYADVLDRDQDHFLLSKGHAASALYGTLVGAGVLTEQDLLAGYCIDGGRLHGHPERGTPGVEMTAGSLGHGPAIAVGIALGERRTNRSRTYCLVGDGEVNEGSVWEALALAGHLRLTELTLIVDANGLQGLGHCSEVLGLEPFTHKLDAFGFAVEEVDGHDHDALGDSLRGRADRPRAIVARTTKGYGVACMEGQVMSHYMTLGEHDRDRVLAELERL